MSEKLVVYGKVFTSDEKNPYAEGFAIKDGKIEFAGTKEELKEYEKDADEVLSYDGLIVPGFTEGHAHISQTLELILGPVCDGHSIEEVQKQIKKFADENPDVEKIMGNSFDPGLFGPKGPTKEIIDEVVSDRPVVINDEGHHSVWVNSKALEICGITKDTENPLSGFVVKDEETGEPTGFLQEAAVGLAKPALPEFTVDVMKKGIMKYQDIGLSYGITNAFEPMISEFDDYDDRIEAYRELLHEDKLKIAFRIGPALEPEDDAEEFFTMLDKVHAEFKDEEKLQYNTVKFFMDGVIDGHTAFLREPYCMPPCDCGPKVYEDKDEILKRVDTALKKGYRTHFHAIGDAAIDEALDAIEYGQKRNPSNDFRNQITHLQVCTPEMPERFLKDHVIAVLNPYWHFKGNLYEPLEHPFLGDERAEHMYYVGSFVRAGVTCTQASDFPVTIPPDSLMSLHMMVNRICPMEGCPKDVYFPEERISVEDALKILTINGAYELDCENIKGSIEKGKNADFVVLSQDVTTCPSMDIYKTKVEETWISGDKVYVRE